MKKSNGFILFYLILLIPVIVLFIFEITMYIKEANKVTSVNQINIINDRIVKDIKDIFMQKVSKFIKGNPKLIEPFIGAPYILKDIKYPVQIKVVTYEQGLIIGNLNIIKMKLVINQVLEKYNIEYKEELSNLFISTFTDFYNNKFFYDELYKNIDYYIELTEDYENAVLLKTDLEKLFAMKINNKSSQSFISTNSLILSIVLNRSVGSINQMKIKDNEFSKDDKLILEQYKIQIDLEPSYLYKIIFIILYKDFNVQITNILLYDLTRGWFVEKYNNRKFNYNR